MTKPTTNKQFLDKMGEAIKGMSEEEKAELRVSVRNQTGLPSRPEPILEKAKHRKYMFLSVLVVLVFIGGWFGWSYYSRETQETAVFDSVRNEGNKHFIVFHNSTTSFQAECADDDRYCPIFNVGEVRHFTTVKEYILFREQSPNSIAYQITIETRR